MVQQETLTQRDRFLTSGDESGTAPGDRPFRPDVEGLRAVAVLLVVLFHAGVPGVSGGYIGVDVFFVISGFVITGLLLRERASSGRTSILAFYGRRCRRIIPAATLVIVVTVFFSYLLLGVGPGNRAADDGRWASVFLANFHFISTGTNYLSATQLPSPLQNYWSLAVEEQFYLVYPALFLLIASFRGRFPLRAKLAMGLTAVIAGSFALSVIQTSSNPVVAYFSPFTRAWELALGSLVAVATPWLLKLPSKLAVLATWTGLGAIVISALVFTSQTPYPGSLVAIPVVGAALVIGGGVRAASFGVELVLGLPPFRWLGRLSYSLYLWHWPALALAAQSTGKASLSVPANLGVVAISLLLAIVTYTAVENPIRHSRFFTRRRLASIGLGVTLSLGAFAIVSAQTVLANAASSPSDSPTLQQELAALSVVRERVAAGIRLTNLPSNLDPPISQATAYQGPQCFVQDEQASVGACIFGPSTWTHTMVLYGDSHAAMWFPAIKAIAARAHWRLAYLAKSGCPDEMLPFGDPARDELPWPACSQWHTFALNRINRLQPDLLIVTQELPVRFSATQRAYYTGRRWEQGLQDMFDSLRTPHTRVVILGNLPLSDGPDCLSLHAHDVQACSSQPRTPAHVATNEAEQTVARQRGAQYIDVIPWLCEKTCPEIIGTHYLVYADSAHLNWKFALTLQGVLASALRLPT